MAASSAGALVITTRPLPEPVALLSWLPAPHGALSWVKQGDGLVGWGVAARLTARGDGRFTQALHWWQHLTAAARIRDDLGTPGSGPVALGRTNAGQHTGRRGGQDVADELASRDGYRRVPPRLIHQETVLVVVVAGAD